MGGSLTGGIRCFFSRRGNSTQDSGLLPFQNGLGVMVQELGIPVVPVAIIGLEKVMPRGAVWPTKGVGEGHLRPTARLFREKSGGDLSRLSERAVKDLLESA